MKIYTKTGDKGTTSLIYGQRVAKNDLRVEAYGTCDETNSMIGLALSYLKGKTFQKKELMRELYHKIQTNLFHVGAELATPKGKEVKWSVNNSDIEEMEKQIDEWNESLPELTNFISARRTFCRCGFPCCAHNSKESRKMCSVIGG